MSEDDLAMVACITGALLFDRKDREQHTSLFLQDKQFSEYHTVMERLRVYNDIVRFKSFIRISPDMFDDIVRRVRPKIERRHTRLREAISVEQRVAIALRFAATGETYRALEFHFRVSHSLISSIIPEVMLAIYEVYKDEYIKCPTTADGWKDVAKGFYEKWQFPHTIGCLDGKHVRITKPPKSGSLSYNYKGFYSFVLMALVDSGYKFIYINIGQPGSSSDGGIFNNSSLCSAITNGTAGLPNPEPLPNDDHPLGYHIIGDDAFALRPWLMKPFACKKLGKKMQIFNYRLSRARRVVENAFGIMAARFRCLLSPLQMDEKRAQYIILGCCILHNMLCERNEPGYLSHLEHEDHNAGNIIPGSWRNDQVTETYTALNRMGRGRHTDEAKHKRNYLMHYFRSEAGKVSWQERMIPRQDEDTSDEEI